MADHKPTTPEGLSKQVFLYTVAGAIAFILAVGILVW